ncbi:hypothetical protein Tco_0594068 [Tanacetum coccineum]
MNNKKHILNLDQFRDILQICPKVGNKKFEEPPLEKEILAFSKPEASQQSPKKRRQESLEKETEAKDSHANGLSQMRNWVVTPGVPDVPDYDSDDDISWKSSKDDQDDKNYDDENAQDMKKEDKNERQTNQYAEALSSIPGIVDHYLANKMQEAVDVAVQLKYDRIREEAHTKINNSLDSIDEE